MITSIKPLSLAETSELVGEGENKKTVKDYIKKYNKIKPEKAKEIRREIESMDNIKIKQEHVSKVIDLLPETQEEISKIFMDVGLDNDESNKIMEIVKKHK